MTDRRKRRAADGGRASGAGRAEVCLGLVVIGLAAWLTGAGAANWAHRRRSRALAADLRTFAPILARYARETGNAAPRPGQPTTLPAELARRLAATNWNRGSPFGGGYEWIRVPDAPLGAITVTAFAPKFPLTATPSDLVYVDTLLDDGNLATGNFRAGYNGWPQYRIAPP